MSCIERHLWLPLLLALCLLRPAAAGVNEWTSSGPARTINTLVPGLAPDRLYAGSTDGLYRSDNDAASWERLDDSLTGHNVLSLAVATDTTAGERLYAGSQFGLYRSLDGGGSWDNLAAPGAGIMALATGPVPGAQERLFVGTFGRGVWVSDDGGASFARPTELVDAQVYALTTSSLDAGTVYAGTADGLFVSRDAGTTWSRAGTALAGVSVRAVDVSSVDPNFLAVGTYGTGVQRSFDGGATWTVASTGLQPPQVRSLAVDDANPDVLYAATSTGGFFRTKDGGINWLPINYGLSTLTSRVVRLDPQDRDRLLAGGAGEGVWEIRFAPEPQIVTDPVDYDFGPIPVGSRATKSLRIDNTGTADLAVSDVRLGASTGYAVDFAGAFVVPAGGSHLLTLTFEPRVRDFILRDEVRITSNDPDESEISVPLSGRGTRSVLSAVPMRVDFGAVSVPPGFRDTTITLTNTGSATLELLGARFDNPRFTVQSFAPVSLAPGRSTTVRVAFQAVLPRPESGNLLLISDSDPDTLKVPVTGTGTAPDMTLSAALLDFGRLTLGASTSLPLTLTNTGTADLTVSRLVAASDQFFVDRTLGVPRDTSFVVPASDTIVVVSGRDTTVSLPTGASTTVSVGRDTTRLISSGDTSLVLTGSDSTVVIIGTQRTIFAASEDSTILAPDSSFTFQVTFRPTRSGTIRDTLDVRSDAPIGFGQQYVVLRGEGNALSLEPSTAIDVGTHPVDLAVGDLDGLPGQDLAVVDSVGGYVHVLLNDGAGEFPDAGRRSYPSTGSLFGPWVEPVAVAAAPLFATPASGAAADLVIGDRVARSLSLVANDGNGRFDGRREDIFIGHQLADVVAVDLDADGDTDLAVANGPDTDTITLLYNDGTGAMSARSVLPVQSGPVALVAGHFDTDGHIDLAVANRFSNSVTVLLNDRNGSFITGGHHAVGVSPLDVSLLDVDADGDLDIAAASAGTRSVSLLNNDGAGGFSAVTAPQSTSLRPATVAAGGMTADIFSDIVAGGRGDFLVFFENVDGALFERQDIDTGMPVRDVHLVDLDANRVNDLVVLSADSGRVQVYHNRLVDGSVPPRAPASVTATDMTRDLGGRIVIAWQDGDYGTQLPEEQIVATTAYTVVRAADVDFSDADTLGSVPGGRLSFTDDTATPYETFYYRVLARRGDLVSAPSTAVSAASLPAPLVDLRLLNAPRVSRGDTLRAQVYLTPAGHDVAGASFFLTYEPSALRLLPMPADTTQPFRVSSDVLGSFTPAINAYHNGRSASGKINLSLISSSPGGGALSSGVDPVLIAEVWFTASQQVSTFLSIDDEAAANRRTAIVEDVSGDFIEPVLGDTTRLTVRDIFVSGTLAPQRRAQAAIAADEATLLFIGAGGDTLVSSINDMDRLQPGIQVGLDDAGRFFLDQIPAGTYRVFAKVATHLQGAVVGDTVTVDSVRRQLAFQWTGPDSASVDSLPAGDANDDNRVNLADFGVLVRYFGSTSAGSDWPLAQQANFDGDSQVGFDDFMLLADNFGRVGMEVLPSARRAGRALPGYLTVETGADGAVLRGHGLPDLRGITLVLPRSVGAQSGEVEVQAAGGFAAVEHRALRWPVAGGSRVALAVTDGPAAGEGELLHLPGLSETAARQALATVELLDEEYRVRRPRLGASLPLTSSLQPSYPNPFNPSTTIPFEIAATTPARLEVFDILGQRVRQLVDDTALAPGQYRVVWDARDDGGHAVASGPYFVRLTTGEMRVTRRLLLLR
jgi:hypothetical protein